MTSKKKNHDDGLGDWIVPVIDLMSILIQKIFELSVWLVTKLLTEYVFKERRNEEVKKINREDLKVKHATLSENALGYSITKKRNIMMGEIDRRMHTMVVGASGFGKSVALDVLMYDDMRNGKPVIMIDPKGSNKTLQNFINMCRLTKREYQIFSHYYEGDGRIALNPAKDGSATSIADRIHYAFLWSDAHYETLCYRALKKACSLLLEKQEKISLESIWKKLHDISDPNDKEHLFERKNIDGIIARLENIVESDFGPKLKSSGASFADIWSKKKCIYIGLPVLAHPRIARALGKIILGDLAYAVSENYKIATIEGNDQFTPVGVYIDELSAVITDEFIELENKCREAKMELTLAFQSPADINKVNPELCQQIFENGSNWLIFKQRMEAAASLFSQAIGTVSGKKRTIRVEGEKESELGSQREVEEMITHNNIFKNLDIGQCVLLRHAPTKVDLINVKHLDPKTVLSNVNFFEEKGHITKRPRVPNANNVQSNPDIVGHVTGRH
ncbi:MAG: TraM recognition domain-containing protein [Bdellovibrio sp.]|nr:TraM recognition domain-containing protein [Bdellovibrio sp.]